MFRIENYITGIIISYIDRYISNFKRQDAQVSLWEGDAVLHNLDLDLEVLDQELNLPFSLVSGHIHELHIHVPWTRIASEPVVITINTIECVMKLKPPGQEQLPKKKKKKKAASNADEAPPTYTAALANKVVYNLNITCNNLILKYVEEDIVLSMNIKTLSAVSVNKQWVPMYCALTPENLILRKLITLTDITICLDKRNASGRIESYLEPILYKCSLKIRISRTFSSPTNLNAIKTRIAIHTDDVTLSISEPQVPMLLRLILLAKVTFNSPKNGSIPSLQTAEGASENNGEDGDEGQSWGSWVWSMVPSLFTYAYNDSEMSSIPQSLDIAAYIDKFNLDLKLVEEGKTWQSFMKATLEGCFVEMSTNTNDWTNLLVGVSYFTVHPLPQPSNDVYIKCGHPVPDYKKVSLYENPDINLVQRTWDLHLAAVTEKVLVDRAPAFSVDFISSVEIQPENWIENYPSEPLEKALMRFVVGTLDINATPGLMERIRTITQSLENYDYPAYSVSTNVSGEDVSLHLKESNSRVLEGLVPLSLYQFTLVEANVKVFASLSHMTASKQRIFNDISRTYLSRKQPYLFLKVKSLDGSITKPMYPEVLVLLKQHITPTRDLISASMTTVSVTALTINLGVRIDGIEVPGMLEFGKLSCSAVFNSIFQSGPEVICLHCSLQLERSTFTSTKPLLLLGWSLVETFLSHNNASFLFNSSLIQDIINSSHFPLLQVSIYKFQGRFAQSRVSESVKLKIGSAEAKSYYVNDPGQDHFCVLSAKTKTENGVFEGVAQRPLNDSTSVPLLLYFKLRQLHVNLDPSVFKWVTYMPQVLSQGNIHSWTSMGSGGLSRKISASSVSSLSKKNPDVVETPKERVEKTAPPAPPPPTNPMNIIQDFAWLMKWLSFAVNGEMADIKFLYKGLSGENSCTLTTYIPSVQLMSAQGKFTIDSDSLPIPFGTLKKNSVSFPLRLEINGISGWSVCGAQRENFFDEFNTTCTVALTSSVVLAPVLSFTLHIDTSHISLSLARHQMACLAEFCNSVMKIMNIIPIVAGKTDELQIIRERRTSGSEDSTSNSQTLATSFDQRASSEKFGFKLSWWLQWTLTKLTISLYTTPLKSSPDLLKLTLEFEDIISSMEVDPVYQKLKMKIGSSTIKHYTRDSLSGKWQIGCYGGYMMCAREPLGHHREFLSLTVTRASAVNLHSRLASLMKMSYKDLTAGQGPDNRYVIEVVICLEPFDFIIAPNVLMRFVSIIEPLLNQSGSQQGSPPGPPLTHLTTADLPLVYFDLNQMRIFLCASVPTSSKPDTVVIQVDDIVLRSEAVNPVSRKMLRCDLSRVTSVPGSRLEDRQYQLDLCLEVTTGRWTELECHVCGNSDADENPAVAWNTVGAPQAGRGAALSTVLPKLKTSFIFAPPILSSGVLVSGLYFEGNMESEADIKLSIDQFRLWFGLLSELNKVIPEHSEQIFDLDSGIESIEGSLNFTYSKESLEGRKISRVLNSQISVATSTSINTRGIRQRTQVVPSDILLTAKSISLNLFSKEENSPKLTPLFYVSITQPYISYEKQGDTTVYKASVFDLNIRHGAEDHHVEGNVKKEDFVFTLLETRDGDPDPYKGIPPALANFKSTALGTKLPLVDFEMGRPVKVILNVSSIKFLDSLQETLFPDSDYSSHSINGIQQQKSVYSLLSYDKQVYLNIISGINVSTKQFAVEYFPIDSCNIPTMTAIAGFCELDGSIIFPGQQTSLNLCVKGITFSVGGHFVLTPWTFGCNAHLINESWTPNYIFRLSVSSDILAFELFPPQINALKSILEELEPILMKRSVVNEPLSGGKITEKEEDDESYRDDLQTGAFQFSSGNDLPLPYQVTFPSPAVMAWAYPYPRAITSLTILPVPFSKPCSGGLELNLEYLDPLQGWCLWAKGTLSESQVSKVELPQQNRTASVWRVILDAEDLPIQSKALGGCVRIDSLFSRRLIPTLQICANIDCLSVCLWAKPQECQPLKRYTPVSCLNRYPFSTISIQCLRIGLLSWLSGEVEIEMDGRPKIEILNARTLKDVTVIPPFPLKLSCFFKEESVKLNVQGDVVTAFVAPSISHSLHAAITGSFVQPYIICNDTSYILSFGQVDTDEDLPLYCLQSYFYAWKNSVQKMNLRFSISTTENKFWSTGVSLSKEGIVPIEVMDDGGRTMCALILVKKLSSVVVQVTFSGELMLKNRLDKCIDVRIVASSIAERQRILRLNGEERCPAVLLTRESSYSIRIALNGGWSGLVPLNEATSWLVKAPQKESGKFISIWCQVLKEDHKGFKRLLVLFSPMYMIKSLLPGDANVLVTTEEFHSKINLRIPGRGGLSNLYTPGTTEQRHALTFHIDGNIPSSTPHVNVSYTDVIQSSAPSTPSLQGALEEEENLSMTKDNWPLLGPPWEKAEWSHVPQPPTVTRVKVRFCGEKLRVPHCILIELEPWCLVVNTLGYTISILSSEEVLCNVPHLSIVAPPYLENTFHLLVNFSEGSHQSSGFQLSDNQSFYKPHIPGLIPQVATVSIRVYSHSSVVFGVLHSKMVQNTRVLHITSAYVISNLSSVDLYVAGYSLKLSSNRKISLPTDLSSSFTFLPKNASTDLSIPLPEWAERGDGNDMRLYLVFKSKGGNTGNPIPVPVLSDAREKETLLLPTGDEDSWFNTPLSVIFQEKEGTTYITVDDDPSPQLIIHNHTGYNLQVGTSTSPQGGSSSEESVDWDWRLTLPKGRCGFYRIHGAPGQPLPPVVVAKTGKILEWSGAIYLSSGTGARLVGLPGAHDLVVTVSKVAFTTHLTLTPAHQSLISAADVRSRLSLLAQGGNQGVTEVENKSPCTTTQELPLQEPLTCRKGCIKKISGLHHIEGTVELKGLFFTLCSDSDDSPDWNEISALSLENIHASLKPQEGFIGKSSLRISIWDVQLDNQMYPKGGYDFCVVMIGRGSHGNNEMFDNSNSLSLPLSVKEGCPAIDVTFGLDVTHSIVLEQIKATLMPVELFLEDTYLFELRDHLKDLCSGILTKPVVSSITKQKLGENKDDSLSTNGSIGVLDNEQVSEDPPQVFSNSSGDTIESDDDDEWEKDSTKYKYVPLPSELVSSSYELSRPLKLSKLYIAPLSVRVSLHTSTKFYIALDQSPLSFAEFKRTDVVTSPYRLGHALSLHYFLGAIYGTGWALGSLQLLGAPAGLARSLGAGLSSLVSLPYEGLAHGPAGFLFGVFHGSASLMRHITAGTLSCVTKLAGSWSRTLDRLTLDSEDLRYAEEMRRLRPHGLAEGIKQGLTEFGVSLLGGVGGLAQRPLEYALGSGGSLVGSVSRGLVGAMARPLSGAAGLVAVTTQGILAGAGWAQILKPKHTTGSISAGRASRLVHGEGALLVVEATSGDLQPCDLVLNVTSLKIISLAGRKDILPLSDIIAVADGGDPTLVFIYQQSNSDMAEKLSQKRIAEFVRESQRALGSPLPPTPPSLDPEPLVFYINPEGRDYFVSYVQIIARHASHKGFSLINTNIPLS